jgi:hypothetical protein
MPKKSDAKPLRPTLESYPEYVQAVGMITIEVGNLETRLADLLSAVLNVDGEVGHAIYFTPRSGVARVEVLENVHEALHPDENLDEEEVKEIRKKLAHIRKRAKTLMDRRNKYAHAHWGVLNETVYVGEAPIKEDGFQKASLPELKKIVSDMLDLDTEIEALIDTVLDARESPADEA